MDADKFPSDRVIQQRLRNNAIEHLEILASLDKQDEYARAVPFVYVPWELITGWEDHFASLPGTTDAWPDTYSPDEVAALVEMDAAFDAAATALGSDFPDLGEVQRMPEWLALRDASAASLRVLSVRGRMSPDVEEYPS